MTVVRSSEAHTLGKNCGHFGASVGEAANPRGWSTAPAKTLDAALDIGFGDVSNLNQAFRAEFGVSPSVYRHGRRA